MCRQFGVPPSTTSLYCSFPPPPPPSRLRGERGPQLTGGEVSPETSPLLLNGARIRARRKSLLSHPVARGVKWTCSTEERARRRSERRKKTRKENVPSSYTVGLRPRLSARVDQNHSLVRIPPPNCRACLRTCGRQLYPSFSGQCIYIERIVMLCMEGDRIFV